MKETFVNTKLLLRVKPEQRISENRLICGSAGRLYESVSFLYFSFFGGAVGRPSNKQNLRMLRRQAKAIVLSFSRDGWDPGR